MRLKRVLWRGLIWAIISVARLATGRLWYIAWCRRKLRHERARVTTDTPDISVSLEGGAPAIALDSSTPPNTTTLVPKGFGPCHRPLSVFDAAEIRCRRAPRNRHRRQQRRLDYQLTDSDPQKFKVCAVAALFWSRGIAPPVYRGTKILVTSSSSSSHSENFSLYLVR